MMKEMLTALRVHAALAGSALTAALVFLEYALPGSVLAFVPLFHIAIISFLLLVSMPRAERSAASFTALVAMSLLLIPLAFLKLDITAGRSMTLLILAAIIILIIAAVALYPRE